MAVGRRLRRLWLVVSGLWIALCVGAGLWLGYKPAHTKYCARGGAGWSTVRTILVDGQNCAYSPLPYGEQQAISNHSDSWTVDALLRAPSSGRPVGARGHSGNSARGNSAPHTPPPKLPRRLGPSSRERELEVAGRTGLEPATSGVTGRCSNRLNYRPRPSEPPLARRRRVPDGPRQAAVGSKFRAAGQPARAASKPRAGAAESLR